MRFVHPYFGLAYRVRGERFVFRGGNGWYWNDPASDRESSGPFRLKSEAMTSALKENA